MARDDRVPQGAQTVFQGELFSIVQWEQRLYDGSTTLFEKAVRPDYAGVLAVTSDNTILITHQEQPGIEPFIALPGGVVEPGETAFETAKRELLEETGYECEDLALWYALEPSSRVAWTLHQYIAWGCTKVAEPSPDAGERITVQTISFEELLELCYEPRFRDRELALQLLQAQRTAATKTALYDLVFGRR